MKKLYVQSNYVASVPGSLKAGNFMCILALLCYLYSHQVIGNENRNLASVYSHKTKTNTISNASTSSIPLGKGTYQLTMIFKKFSAPATIMAIKAESSIIIDDLRKYQPSNKDHSFSVTREVSIADGTLNLEYGDEIAKVMITMLFKKTSSESGLISPAPDPAPAPPSASEDVVAGVNYEYYIGKWGMLPPFNKVTVREKGVASNFSLAPRDRDDFFGFRFKAYIKIDQSGEYTFYTKSDDGSRLMINNSVVVDNNGKHAMIEKSGKVQLSKGLHPIEVTYFEYTGGENLIVSYEGPGISKRTIPNSVLFTSNNGTLPSPDPIASAPEEYKINFTANLTSSTWNNFATEPAAGKSIQLKNTEGKASSIILKLESTWNDAKDKGYTSGNNTGIYPDAVMQTYFYTTGEESISINGLNSKQSYDFTFFASSAYGGDRTTEFIINGRQVSVNAAYNKDKTVTLKGITPDSQGKVSVKVRKTSSATYAFLNAMVIKTAGTNARTTIAKKATNVSEQLVTEEATIESQNIKIYPVPAKDVLYVETPANSAFTIYSLKGQIVKQGEVNQFKTNSLSVTDLRPGIYHIHFVSDNHSTIRKFIIAP